MAQDEDKLLDRLLAQKTNRPGADTYSGVRDWWRKTFNSDLPAKNIGASDFERRAGHEHSRAFDVGLSPNSKEGKQLIAYLKSQGIPYSAFDKAIYKNGKPIATGPHIHVGIPSPNIGAAKPAQDPTDDLLDRLLQQKASGAPPVAPPPTSKEDARAAYYERASKALRQPGREQQFIDTFPQHLDWHLGIPANIANWWFGQLPADKKVQVAKAIASAVAQDEVKKSQGARLVKDPKYQADMRRTLGVFYKPSASAGQAFPSAQSASLTDAQRLAGMSLPRRMLTEAWSLGIAGLQEAYSGATRVLAGSTYQHPLTPEEDWKVGGRGVQVGEAAKQRKAASALGEQIKPMPGAARTATSLGAGLIEYAPLMAVPEAGLESIFARMAVTGVAGATYTGAQAIGREEKSEDVVMEAATAGTEFALMGAPKVAKPLTKEAETAFNKTMFRRAASNVALTVGGVGGGVTLIERATGKPWGDAATQGFLLMAMRHAPDLLKLVKVRTPQGLRTATVPEVQKALEAIPPERRLPGARFEMQTAEPAPGTPGTARPGAQAGRVLAAEPAQGELFTATRPGEVAGRADLPGVEPQVMSFEEFAKSRGIDYTENAPTDTRLVQRQDTEPYLRSLYNAYKESVYPQRKGAPITERGPGTKVLDYESFIKMFLGYVQNRGATASFLQNANVRAKLIGEFNELVNDYADHVRTVSPTYSFEPQQMLFTMAGPGGERVPIFNSRLESPQDAILRLERIQRDPAQWNELSKQDKDSINKSLADLKSGKSPSQILDEAGLTQQYPGVMRMSEETARRNLQEMKGEFDRLKNKKSRSKDEKRTMGALKTQIEALEKQQAGELPNVTRETLPTEERTRPRWSIREQLAATPEQLRLMRREQRVGKGPGVRVIPDVQQTSVPVNDPVVGNVDVPIWQQLNDERGFINLEDMMKLIEELRKRWPGFSEGVLRSMALKHLERAREAGVPEGKAGMPTESQVKEFASAFNDWAKTQVAEKPVAQPEVKPEAAPAAPKREAQEGVKVVKRGEATTTTAKPVETAPAKPKEAKPLPSREDTIKSIERAIEQTKGTPEQAYFKNLLKDYVTGADRGFRVTPEGEVERVEPAPRGPRPVPEAPSAKSVPVEPGTERYQLRVQKGPGGWTGHVFDSQYPNEPPVTVGPFPTRDAAIDAGGARALRLNRQGEAGFVNVSDAFDAVRDFFRGLPKGISKDLYAATIKALQSHESAQAGIDVQRLRAFDGTFEAAEVAANRLPKQVLQDIMRARGNAETADGKIIQAAARQRLAAIKQPYLRDLVGKLTAAAQESYDLIHTYGVRRGVDLAYREDYFRGLWQAKDAAKVDRVMQQWGTTEGYTKRKAILTVADGEGYGLELANYNPFTNARKELTSIERRQSMKDLATHLQTLPGLTADARKISFEDKMKLLGKGWVIMRDSAFEGLLIEPTYAKYLNKLMDANFMNQKRPLRAMREVSRTFQKAKFMGSIFHFRNMIKASIAAETGGIFDPRGYHDVWKAMKGSFDLKKAGINPLSKEHLEYINLSGGHRRAMEVEGAQSFGQELNVLLERALTPHIGEAGAKAAEVVRLASRGTPGAPGFQRWQFNSFIPVLKEIKYFRDLASEEIAKGRPLTDYEKIDIIKRNQNFYGEMNEQLLSRSRGMTSFLRIPFTAPGFGEGNLRTMARAFVEPARAVGKLRRGEKITKMDIRSAQFMINSWIASALFAQAATRILTGKWATPHNVREMFLVNTGEVDRDGAPIYFDTLSYDKDYFTMLGFMFNVAGAPKSLKEKIGVQPTLKKSSDEIVQRIAGATAPAMGAVGMVGDYIFHRQIYDWRGRPMLEEGNTEQNLKALGDMAVDRFEPIVVSTLRQSKSAGLSYLKALVYSTGGVRPVRLPGIYNLAHDFNVEHGAGPRGVFEPSEYQDLTTTLGTPAARASFDELHKKKTTGDILKYYKDRTTRPLTGSKEREELFLKTLTPEQLQWYAAEYAKRRQDLQQIEVLTGLAVPPSKPKMPSGPKKPSVYNTK